MKEEIKLLCRDCAVELAGKYRLGEVSIDYENEHCGYCDDCPGNVGSTGHLLVVKRLIIEPEKTVKELKEQA